MRWIRCGACAALLVAPADAGARQPTPSQLLIVAPRELESIASEYAGARREDLPTEVLVLEDALAASPGADTPERLKRAIFDRWVSGGKALKYVLLIGDADVMPVRYMVLDRAMPEAFDYAFYPSDLYYADLAKADGSFDDWNGNKEGFHTRYFGEVRGEKNKTDPMNFDGISYTLEVAVGRWPVSTARDAGIVARKSEQFARYGSIVQQVQGALETQARAGLIAVGGWVENRPAMDAIASRLAGWRAEKRYWKGAGRDDATPPPNEASVVQLLNTGTRLVLHSGHGSDTDWAGSISVGSIPKLHNQGWPAVMMSAGCSTARLATLPPYEAYTDVDGHEHAGTNCGEKFDAPPPAPACYQRGPHNPTGLGEQLLRAGPDGAAVYIGCNTGSQPCGMTLMAGFAEGIAAGHERVGDCWIHAVRYYWEHERLADLKPTEDWYPASVFFQGMKFIMFGDPSLKVPREERVVE